MRHAPLAIGTLAALVIASSALAQDPPPSRRVMVTDRIVVKGRPGQSKVFLANRIAQLGARLRTAPGQAGPSREGVLSELNLDVVEVDPSKHIETLNDLASRSDVSMAAPVYRYDPSFVPNDPKYSSQYHHPLMGSPRAWDTSPGGSSAVIIGICDTGVDSTHSDLAANMVAGFNFYDNNTDARDVHGHGTAVAGCAAAAGNNGIGVTGVAYASRILPCRISDASGSAYSDTIAAAMKWAVDHGAKVVNCSFGPLQGDSVIESAAAYVRSRGGLVFVSAGNDGTRDPTPPSSNILFISATNSSDSLTSWSTYGPAVRLAAPGSSILTTSRGGGYSTFSGTSFSSPIAAGCAALVWGAVPGLTNAQVENFLTSTAKDLGTSGFDEKFGYGRVDVGAALASALNGVVTTPPSVSIGAPCDGSVVSGVVPITVTASDSYGLKSVAVSVDGVQIASGSGSLTASWNSSTASAGTHTVTAVATNIGSKTASATISLVTSSLTPSLLINGGSSDLQVKPGSALQVAVSNDPGRGFYDWIGLFPVGSTSYVAWAGIDGTMNWPSTGARKSVFNFTAPLTGGPFQFQFRSCGSVLASSPRIAVVVPSLSVNGVATGAVQVVGGSSIRVDIAQDAGGATDWIGLVTTGGTTLIDWRGIDGTKNWPPPSTTRASTIYLTAPATTGTYEIRYYTNGTPIVTRSPINVSPPPPPALIVNSVPPPSPVDLVAGSTFQVAIENSIGGDRDWIGLYASESSTTYLDWRGIDGTQAWPPGSARPATISFTAPATPGTYELRYFSAGAVVATRSLLRVLPPNVTLATLTSPAPGSTLTSEYTSFQWSTGSGVLEYRLEVGSSAGGSDVFSRSLALATSTTVRVPIDGRSLFVRLWSRTGSEWTAGDYLDYRLTAPLLSPALAVVTSPAPRTVLPSSTVTFGWTPGTGVTEYWLQVGRTLGGTDFFSASVGNATSIAVSGLPQNGSMVYTRIWSRISGKWGRNFTDAVFYTSGGRPRAVLGTPDPTMQLPGSTATFQWSPVSGAVEYWLQVGDAVGGSDYFTGSAGSNTGQSVSGLPTDGRDIFVRLWTRTGAEWATDGYVDFRYVAAGP